MKNIPITLQSEIQISFSDPKKARSFFIDGIWKEAFFEFSDINELAEHIALVSVNTDAYYNGKSDSRAIFIEGFGYFIEQSNRSFVAKTKEFGNIHILTTSELDVI